jgi:hypothetical protein
MRGGNATALVRILFVMHRASHGHGEPVVRRLLCGKVALAQNVAMDDCALDRSVVSGRTSLTGQSPEERSNTR